MSATTPLLTAEEFARLPDNPREEEELVLGAVVRSPLRGFRYGLTCGALIGRVGVWAHEHPGVSATAKVGLLVTRNPDSVRTVDAACWQAKLRTSDPYAYPKEPPEFAALVLDSFFTRAALPEKLAQLLAFGIRLLWIADTNERTVSVYRGGQPLQTLTEADTLDGEDVLPGFSSAVRELFA